MAGKDAIPPTPIVTNGVMTGVATVTSSVVNVLNFDNIGFQANFTGTPNGSFFVDVCMDYNANTGNAGNWTPATTVPASPAATGSAGTQFFQILSTTAAYVRCRYVNSSSVGVLTHVYLTAKMI